MYLFWAPFSMDSVFLRESNKSVIMKMIIEGLVCHFPSVTYLNFKRDFMDIMPQSPPPPNFKWCDFFLLLHKIHGVLHEKLALIISIRLLLWVSPTSILLNKENMCILLQNSTFWILLKCRFPWITSWRRREMAVWAHRWNPITGASMRWYIVL